MKELRNFTEEAVKIYLDKWFNDADVCHCDDCRLDVMAIMVNTLPQKYVVTDKGALFAQLSDFDPQNRTDFMTVMIQAVQTVSKGPRHEKPKS